MEILALRHQLNILRRKSPKRPTLGSIDRRSRQYKRSNGAKNKGDCRTPLVEHEVAL